MMLMSLKNHYLFLKKNTKKALVLLTVYTLFINLINWLISCGDYIGDFPNQFLPFANVVSFILLVPYIIIPLALLDLVLLTFYSIYMLIKAQKLDTTGLGRLVVFVICGYILWLSIWWVGSYCFSVNETIDITKWENYNVE